MNESLRQMRIVNTHQPFQIGDWLVEPDSGRLVHGGRSIKLEPKVMGLLVYLVQRPGQVLSRVELEQAIWAGTVVGYDALTNAIIKLRKAFGDDPHHPWLVETVAKKGYRLIAPVCEHGSASPAPMSGTIVQNQRLLGAATLAALALIALTIGWFTFDHPGSRANRIPSIAVLPFTNLGGDPKLAYFSDGVREDIITDLSKLSGLRVIARNPAPASPDQLPALEGVTKTLGARYVLEGSVRRSGDDIRITAKLIDAETGSHLWAEGYNRQMRDIFAVQVDVTRNIVTALALTLTDEEKEYVARHDTRSVEAYDLFLQGQARYARNLRDDNTSARDYFLRALALDAGFTRAHGALALTHADDFRFAWSSDPAASADAALRHAERAVALDARSPQAHWVVGFVQLYVRKDHAAALKMGERAIALDPINANAHGLLAVSHAYVGNTEAAVRLGERAIQLDPDHTARYRTVLGLAHYVAGRYDKARAALEQALEQNPARLQPQLYLAATLNRLGKPDEARWLADTIRTGHPGFKLQTWADTQPFANQTQLRKIVDDLHRAGLN
jgi:adenylate cyclase